MKCSVVVPFVICLLIAAAIDSALAAEASRSPATDETRFIDELYRVDLLPRLQPGETCKMFSSYDRTGGNDDGFSGKYSKLRVEDGNSVLAEMDGPGCIQRMHFTHSEYGVPGLLGRKGEHVRIYLDGDKKPALDVPLEDIFYGKLEGFPRPVADVALGGFYCYVPIPYRKSCKVVVDGTDVRFVQIVYRTFPTAKGIVTFRYPPSERQRKAMAKVVKAWTSCGDLSLSPLGLDQSSKLAMRTSKFALKAGGSLNLGVPRGPAMIRALCMNLKPEYIQNAGGARLQITWDDAKSPAVDLPLDYFFCQANKPIPFRSLLVGNTKGVWYNFMPMPYRSSGKITLRTSKPLEGTLAVLARPPEKANTSTKLGYLHAVYHESLPTKTGVYHPVSQSQRTRPLHRRLSDDRRARQIELAHLARRRRAIHLRRRTADSRHRHRRRLQLRLVRRARPAERPRRDAVERISGVSQGGQPRFRRRLPLVSDRPGVIRQVDRGQARTRPRERRQRRLSLGGVLLRRRAVIGLSPFAPRKQRFFRGAKGDDRGL